MERVNDNSIPFLPSSGGQFLEAYRTSMLSYLRKANARIASTDYAITLIPIPEPLLRNTGTSPAPAIGSRRLATPSFQPYYGC
jgi:hypothetical protein